MRTGDLVVQLDSLQPCTLLLPLPSSSDAHDHELGCHRLAAGGGFWEAASHTNTHALPQLTRTHTHTQTHIHTDIDTHTETHTLPQLTRLNTSHRTLNR